MHVNEAGSLEKFDMPSTPFLREMVRASQRDQMDSDRESCVRTASGASAREKVCKSSALDRVLNSNENTKVEMHKISMVVIHMPHFLLVVLKYNFPHDFLYTHIIVPLVHVEYS